MSVFDLYDEPAAKEIAPDSWWLDPETNALYQANKQGYFEQIHSGTDGIAASGVFKFAELPHLIETTHQEWITRSINSVNKSIVIPTAEAWAPWEEQIKAAQKLSEEQGISSAQFLAFLGPIVTEYGKTAKAYGYLMQKLETIHKGKAARSELCGETSPEPTQMNAPAPVLIEHVVENFHRGTEMIREAAGIDQETGEVIDVELVYELLGLDSQKNLELLKFQSPEEFTICDDKTADWFVSKVRALQDECDRIAEMAQLGIAERLRHMQGMLYRYGQQLADYDSKLLPTTKKGDYRVKNVKHSQGGVFFKKSGGWKVTDRLALQRFIDSLPNYQHKYKEALASILDALEIEAGAEETLSLIKEYATAALDWKSPLDNFPVRIERRFNQNDMINYAKQGVKLPGIEELPVKELATFGIGGKRAWSVRQLAQRLKLNADTYKLLAQDEDDIVEGEGQEI